MEKHEILGLPWYEKPSKLLFHHFKKLKNLSTLVTYLK